MRKDVLKHLCVTEPNGNPPAAWYGTWWKKIVQAGLEVEFIETMKELQVVAVAKALTKMEHT